LFSRRVSRLITSYDDYPGNRGVRFYEFLCKAIAISREALINAVKRERLALFDKVDGEPHLAARDTSQIPTALPNVSGDAGDEISRTKHCGSGHSLFRKQGLEPLLLVQSVATGT
jgi:hypothetical protein